MTYVSCLGYCHRLKGFSDPSKVLYLKQMLKGFNKVGFRLDSRLPITLLLITFYILRVFLVGVLLSHPYWNVLLYYNFMYKTSSL